MSDEPVATEGIK